MQKKVEKPRIFSQIKANKYYKAAEDGFWRIWKNKNIWFWGLFISAGTASSFGTGNDNPESISEESVAKFFSDYWQWILAGFILFLIFIILAWIFSAIARTGVIKELNKKQNNKKHVFRFKKIWVEGLKDFKKIIGLDLIILGAVLLVFCVNLVIASPLFIGEKNVVLILILVITVSISLLFVVFLLILKPFTQVVLLLANLSKKESFFQSWKIIKNNVNELFKLLLTFIGIGFIKGLIFVLISSVGTISVFSSFYFGSYFYGNGVVGEIIASVILVILLLAFFLIVLTISSFFALWKMDVLVWWTKEVGGDKVDKEEKIKVEKVVAKNKKSLVGVAV